MKIWISFDMEGVAGIVDWDQCRPSGGARYDVGCQLMLAEVNAAIEGAIAGGATEIVLNDSHGTMANLDPRAVAGNASYIAGRHKPMYMMEGLDGSFDAIFLVGYHGSISGRPSTLSHTYNPEVFAAARVNGELVGESGINALVAEHFGVPIAFVSGDSVTWAETAPFAPGAEHVVTKESITRFAADSLHPADSCRLIRAAAEQAVRRVAADVVRPPRIARPATLELDLQTGDMAEVATWARDTERVAEAPDVLDRDQALLAGDPHAQRAALVLAHPAPHAVVLPGLEGPGEALFAHLAASAHLLGLLDLHDRGTGVADREEQFRVLVEARGTVTPIHGWGYLPTVACGTRS